ncbi:MAG: hypothetical protein OXR67_11240, partial [Chloroflexota bacterium]|nr:hypothetical protein [Chloroflexota bacterium]
MRPARCLLVLVLAALAAVPFLTPGDTIRAHDLPDFQAHGSDIRLESTPYNLAISGWVITVHNERAQGYVPSELRDVKIQLTVEPASLLEPEGWGANSSYDNDGIVDSASGVWSIPSIPAGGSATLHLLSASQLLGRGIQGTPVRFNARLISSIPAEPAGLEANSETEVWYLADGADFDYTRGDAGVAVSFVSKSDTEAEFEIVATNDGKGNFGGVGSHHNYDSRQFDVRVQIELSPGLRFASVPSSPDVVAIDERTWTWNAGTTGLDYRTWPTETLPVVVTSSPSLEDLPLEERCLTATVVNAVPPFALDPNRLANNVATVCLEHPKQVVTGGEIILWWIHDCVGVTTYPCGNDGGIQLFVRTDDTSSYLGTESVIVNVRDPDGRAYDSHSNSVNGGSEVSWQTRKRNNVGEVERGVYLHATLEHLAPNSSSWSTYGPETVTLSSWQGETPPGKVGVRPAPNFSYDLHSPGASETRGSFTNAAWLTRGHIIFEFETLGTYVVNYQAEATSAGGTTYEDDGNYIFHVGPIAELAVMDSGEASPLAAAGQTAYTIQAANIGPDTAPAVLVTLTSVPQGAEAITSEGIYRETSCSDGLCEAEWDLGEITVSESRPSSGQTEYSTLTLIAPDGVPTGDITATIANTEDYSVVIDGVAHSTPYFDYIEENNAATIMAQPGTGEGAPGTPQDLRGQFFDSPPTAVVQWTDVDLLNRFPVSHYQVWKFEDETGAVCQAPRVNQGGSEVKGTLYLDSLYVEDSRTCYYVRAVNVQGVPGYWSEAVTATSEGLD